MISIDSCSATRNHRSWEKAMSSTQDTDSVTAMKVLRNQIREKLCANADFRALVALENAIAEVEGPARTLANQLKVFNMQTSSEGSLTAVAAATLAAQRAKPTHSEAAARVLEETGRPLPTPELMQRSIALGTSVGGNEPLMNFGSSISRDKRFESVRLADGTRAWWFRGRAFRSSAFDLVGSDEPAELGNPAQESETADSP